MRATSLRFADDTTPLCNSKEELLTLLKQVKDVSKAKHLLLNTQTIMVIQKYRERRGFHAGWRENRWEALYIWDPLSTFKSSSTRGIRRRLAIARGVMQSMVAIWKSSGMSIGLNVRFLHGPPPSPSSHARL